MDYISRINGLPLSELSETQTDTQQQKTADTGPSSTETTIPTDEIVPFDPNPFENLLGLSFSSAIESPLEQLSTSDTQFNSSGAASGSTTVGQINTKSGGASVQGQTDIAGHARYDVAIDLDKGMAKADIDIGGSVDSHYKTEFKDSTNIDGHEVSGSASVGAELHSAAEAKGSAVVQVNDSGARVDIQGEAFAGGQAGIEGNASLSIDGTQIGSVKGGVEGWLGVGVEGGVTASYQNGVLSFSASAGAALGGGGKVSVGFNINVGAIGNAIAGLANDLVNDLSAGASAVASKLGEAAGAVAGAFAGAADAIGGFARDLGEAFAGAASDVADAVGKGLEAIGDGIVGFFNDIFGGSSADSAEKGSSAGETGATERSQEQTEEIAPEEPDDADDTKAENADDTSDDDDSPIDPHDGEDGLPVDDGSGGGGPTWMNSMQETSGATDPDSGDAGDDTGGGITIGSESIFGSGAAKVEVGTDITDQGNSYPVSWEDGGYVMPNADPYDDGTPGPINPNESAATVALNGSLMSAFNAVFTAPDAAKTAEAESQSTS